eukprot:gene7310-7523_t
MSDEEKLLADAAKLSVEERCVHTSWKVRSAAYEHIKAACEKVFDSSDPVLSEFVGVFPKATAEGNAAALDKALEALAAWLDKASDSAAARIAHSSCNNIVSKALGARPSTATKGMDCLAAFIVAEQSEKATAALIEGYGNKVPKVVVGALDATLQLVRDFGGQAMPAQQVIKAMAALFECKDDKARTRAKDIVIELARYVGPECIHVMLLKDAPEVVKKELETRLQELPPGRPKPARLTRKEAAKAAAQAVTSAEESEAANGASAAGGATAAEEPEQVDLHQFMAPKDIIPDLNKEFWDGLLAAKWSERKGALAALRELAAYPHLANGDYADLNRELKKIINKDSNIQVVAEAINCTANIAKGLRKDYRGPAMTLCPVLLEKFKDKASVVNKAAAEALGAMAKFSFSLADVAEDVSAALAHQNPKVKESTLCWLATCITQESKAGMSKLLPQLLPAAVKCTDEGSPVIREAAFAFLVQTALKAGSLSALDKYLAKMDEAKRKKLEEMVQEAAKARRPGGAGPAPPPARAAAVKVPSRSASRPSSVRLEAMEAVVAKAQGPEASDAAVLLTQSMAHLPGWDEKNFQGGTDKLADLKLKDAAFQMLLASSEAVGPQLVAALLYKRAAAHTNPKVLTEAINWINLAISDFLLPAFDVKTVLGWAKDGLGSANAATRTAATQLLGTLHGFLGPALADMVRPDLKPALMATVEVEFGKHPQQSGWQATRVSRVAAARGKAAAGRPVKGKAGAGGASAATEEPTSMDDLLPRADISGQITGELVSKLCSANWKERKEGLDEVEAIIAAAGGRIQPSVGDLMPALKGRLTDSNKNLIAQTLSLIGKLAKAMGRAIAREARPVLGPALRCICDSKPNVRAAVVELLESWTLAAPLEAPFDELLEVLPSPKCVSEGMQAGIAWMASVYTAGKGTSTDCVALAAKAVAIGAGYKTPQVREAAGKLLDAMLAAVGVLDVQQAIQGLDKALQKVAAEALSKSAAASSAPSIASRAAMPSQPGTAGSSGGSTGGVRSSTTSRPGSAASVRSSASAGSRPGTGGGAGKSVAASGVGSLLGRVGAAPGAAVVCDDGPLLSLDKGKDERAKKARFKSSKFEIRPDEVQQLEMDLGALTAPGLKANMFAKDFKKQVLAADALKAWITMRADEAYEACIACLDLLLRWSVVRLAEGNTQTLVSVTSMLKVLLEACCDRGYLLSEWEVKSFLPGLVEKCGQPQPNVRADCRDLMRRVSMLYPPAKVLVYIQEGLNSKNNRSRVACAEEIGCMVAREGPRVYSGAKCDVLAALAKRVADPGKDIRAAALGALEEVYAFEGEAIWKQLGALNGQQKGILEERFKTLDKDLAKKGLAAGYKLVEFKAAQASQVLAAVPCAGGVATTGLDLQPAASRLNREAAAGDSLSSGAMPTQNGGVIGRNNEAPSSRVAEREAEFGRCLAVLQHGHVDDVVEVMKLMCYEMMDLQRSQVAAAAGGGGLSPQAEQVQQLLLVQADALVVVLTAQTQQVFTAASASMRSGSLPPAHSRACKYALNTLMNIFNNTAMPDCLSASSLTALVRVLLLRLVDDNLARLPEGEALLKALNVLMLKILENSNRNYTFSALLTLLLDVPQELELPLETVSGQNAQQSQLALRWADLVVKCLIKSTKALPQIINTMDLRSLLLSIHGFFEVLGVNEIRRRSHTDDKPLRMVKTILHELCKLKGTDIYRYTADIPQQGSTSGSDGKPVIFPYIDLNIQTLQGNGAIRAVGAAGPGGGVTPGKGLVAAGGAAAGAVGPRTPAATLKTQTRGDNIVGKLSAVFTRLSAHMQASSKDSSEKRAVLLDIYSLSQEQGLPIDKLVTMYLPDTTQAFKSWIAGEMNKIDEEQQQQQGRGSGSSHVCPATPGPGPASPTRRIDGCGFTPAPAASIVVGSTAATSSVDSGTPGLGALPDASRATITAAGGMGPTMEALKLRMSQLQSEKNRMLSASKHAAAIAASGPAGGALASVAAGNISELGGLSKGVAGGAPPTAGAGDGGGGSIGVKVVGGNDVAAAGGVGGMNLQELKSRMKAWQGSYES